MKARWRSSSKKAQAIQTSSRSSPPPQWYRGEDGLPTVVALIAALENDTAQLGTEGAIVLEELHEYETVLRKTAERDLRWHLAVSWR